MIISSVFFTRLLLLILTHHHKAAGVKISLSKKDHVGVLHGVIIIRTWRL